MRLKARYIRRFIFFIFGLCCFSIYRYTTSNTIDNSSFFLPYNKVWKNNSDIFIEQEFKPKISKCSGNFVQYKNKFVVIKNVLIDKTKSFGLVGGENLQKVLNQSEQSEFYKYQPGFISIPCSDVEKEDIIFPLGKLNHINEFYSSLSYFPLILLRDVPHKSVYNRTLLFVTRNEYANFYHTITDLYVIFIVCRILKLRREEIHVVLTDGHPWSDLDHMWHHLFPHFSRLSQFPTQEFILVKQLVWIPFGYIAPIMQLHWPTAPMLQEFRDDILSRYHVHSSNDSRSCRHVSILFLWRHNYLAHPRNPSGEISRKISNEGEIVSRLSLASSSDRILSQFNISIRQYQLDRLPMGKQLRLMTRTNILIGMHGAGLTHALFLPPGAGLIELFPLYYDERNTHFRVISMWRGLHYEFFANKNSKLEVGQYLTFISPEVVIDKVKRILTKFRCLS